MKLKTKTDTEPMDEAYKMLDGSPSATGVSDAAKGETPEKDDAQFRENTEEKNERLYGSTKRVGERDHKCTDIDEAYAMLFEALAIIMKK